MAAEVDAQGRASRRGRLDAVVGADLAPRVVDLAAVDGRRATTDVKRADGHGQHQDEQRQVAGGRVAPDRAQPEDRDEVAAAAPRASRARGPGRGRAGS